MIAKVLLVFVFTNEVVFTTSTFNFENFGIYPSNFPELTPEVKVKLGQLFNLAVTNYFQTANFNPIPTDLDDELRMPVLPGFESDVVELKDAQIKLSPTSEFANWIHGDIHYYDVKVNGLSTIFNNLRFEFPWDRRLTVHYIFKFDKIRLDGRQANDVILFRDSFTFTSNGAFFVEVTNFQIRVTLEISNIFQKFDVDKFFITELSFDQFRLNFDNTRMNNGDILRNRDWVGLSATLSWFLSPIVSKVVRPVTELVLKPVVHDLLDECNPWNFIVGDFACIGRPTEDDNNPYPNQVIENPTTRPPRTRPPWLQPQPQPQPPELPQDNSAGAKQTMSSILLLLLFMTFLRT